MGPGDRGRTERRLLDMSNVRPWQVWWVDLGDPIGSEQGGRRPAVIVASALHCQFPIDMTLVAPLTTRNRRLPHHVPIVSANAGLEAKSFARTEDVRSISTRRLVGGQPIGRLSETEQTEVRRWIRRMLV
jgi:mRNA interferase MazF